MAKGEYERGRKAAATDILRHIIPDLGKPEKRAAILEVERRETLEAVRELCDLTGHNGWPDTVHLADAIRNYVRPYMK